MKFNVRVFMGDKEVSDEELKRYAIRSNTVDRIVNSVVDRAIVQQFDGRRLNIDDMKFIIKVNTEIVSQSYIHSFLPEPLFTEIQQYEK